MLIYNCLRKHLEFIKICFLFSVSFSDNGRLASLLEQATDSCLQVAQKEL